MRCSFIVSSLFKLQHSPSINSLLMHLCKCTSEPFEINTNSQNEQSFNEINMKDDVILLNLKEDVEFKSKDVIRLSGFF